MKYTMSVSPQWLTQTILDCIDASSTHCDHDATITVNANRLYVLCEIARVFGDLFPPDDETVRRWQRHGPNSFTDARLYEAWLYLVPEE